MDKFVSKHLDTILLFVFPFSVIVDLINGFFQKEIGIHTPIGVLYRSVILFLVSFSVLSSRSQKWQLYFSLFAFVFLFGFLHWIVFRTAEIVPEIEPLIRFIYGLFMIVFFQHKKQQLDFNRIIAVITVYGLLISTAIIFSYFTGFGINTYSEDWGFGVKSFFTAGNDVGISILFSGVFAYIHFVRQGTFLSLLMYILVLSGIAFVGTRVAMVGFALLSLISISHFISEGSRTFSKKARLLSKSLLSPLLLLGLIFFSIYIFSQLDDFALSRLQMSNIVSGREHLTSAAKSFIASFSGLDWLFGKGKSNLFGFVADYNHLPLSMGDKSVEADFYEFVAAYGIIGGSLCLFPSLYYAVKSIKLFLRSKSIDSFLAMFLCTAYIFVSYSGGHVINNIMLAPLYACVCVFLLSTTKHRVAQP